MRHTRVVLLVLVFVLGFAGFPHSPLAQSFEELVVQADKSMGRAIKFVDKRVRSTGSGFLLSKVPGTNEFFYLTNEHVISGADAVSVNFLRNGQVITYVAQFVDSSPELDLAVLKIKPYEGEIKDYHFLPVAQRDIRKGEEVAALGYPGTADILTRGLSDPAFYETTLTQGAVSKVFRAAWNNTGRKLQIVQHTASINAGNSGGPLMDTCGQVIGLNTQGAIIHQGDRGANNTFWASSSNTIGRYLEDLNVPYSQVSSSCGATGQVLKGGQDVPVYVYVIAALAGVGAVIAIVAVALKSKAKSTGSSSSGRSARDVPAAGGKAILELSTSNGERVSLSSGQLKAGVTMGRSSDHAVYIDDENVSRNHARLDLRGRALQVSDLGSTNGTYVDGKRLKPNTSTQVNTKSSLRLGDVTVRLQKPG